jgi:hypothetical protein
MITSVMYRDAEDRRLDRRAQMFWAAYDRLQARAREAYADAGRQAIYLPHHLVHADDGGGAVTGYALRAARELHLRARAAQELEHQSWQISAAAIATAKRRLRRVTGKEDS